LRLRLPFPEFSSNCVAEYDVASSLDTPAEAFIAQQLIIAKKNKKCIRENIAIPYVLLTRYKKAQLKELGFFEQNNLIRLS